MPIPHQPGGPAVGQAIDPVVTGAVEAIARRARTAARELAVASTDRKNAALRAMADGLVQASDGIVRQNGADLSAGRDGGLAAGLLDRIELSSARIAGIAESLREVAGLPDPVGEVVRGSTLANGLRLRQVRTPMGVVAMVYEARPNVTVDAAALGLKSGNAVILRGGSAAARTNAEIVAVLGRALGDSGMPVDAVQSVDHLGRAGVRALMRARGLVDLLVPRGGAGLIATVVRESQVPVVETGVGNCHVYVDASADLVEALAIVVDSKASRPSVCNAAETLLVHEDIAESFLPAALGALDKANVRLHADARTASYAPSGVAVVPLTDEDWSTEYHSLDLAVGIVADIDSAIEHIRAYSTGHTEAICTRDLGAAERFVAQLDSAAVMVNASTRFTDGGQFGLGAEIGISTQKLHARGPMGLAELTTTKWVVWGSGQVRH
jgi:glutamate-5-semialdehyde dehydrogenase